MIRHFKAIGAVLLALSVAACASSSPTGESAFLRSLGDQAQPSAIVATELAFAREARAKGERKAYGNYAAEGAVVFDQGGPKSSAEYIAERSDAAAPPKRDVRHVFMSCKGSHAASIGAFSRSDGTEGIYTTIWERQKKGDYRFIVDLLQSGERWEGDDDMVRTTVAECEGTTPAARAQLLKPLRSEMDRDAGAMNVQMHQGVSPDQSFAWFAVHASAQDRGIMFSTFMNGRWVTMAGQREEPSDMMMQVPTPAVPVRMTAP